MALVMLPCDLPWWGSVQRLLTQVARAGNTQDFVATMATIHNMCNISLDPDEERPDPTQFSQLEWFLDSALDADERRHFLEETAPAMVQRALQLKLLKPPGGLHFSLQQQADRVELDRKFVASLLAHAFFSTFPKRTMKTHPTLQDFNFTNFFKHLPNPYQQAKLRSILHYFDLFEAGELPEGKITFSRQVMSSKSWLTIEDWLECSLPLSPLSVRHNGRLDRSQTDALHVCFSSSRIGGDVLDNGNSQECIELCTQPELLVLLACVESLEDNEIVSVDGVQRVARIHDPKNRATFERVSRPDTMTICCMDAENYCLLPASQFEEDNILRELNKCLLGFRQQQVPEIPDIATRRLSPIGESFSSTPPEQSAKQQNECSPPPLPKPLPSKDLLRPPSPDIRRGRFIVLGSSGEYLPVTRQPLIVGSLYSSCHSDTESDEYHSARTSLDTEDNDSEGHARRYSAQLDTPERRSTFAARLRDALCREANSSLSTDSSYAVGISVAGSGVADGDTIRLKRGGSRGFILQEDSMDDQFLKDSLQHEQEWLDKFRSKQPTGLPGRKETGDSSRYSFSTEYSSDLEELYDQYNQWLEYAGIPDILDDKRELTARDLAVVRFAGSLLKRTLSDSFAGVPMDERDQGRCRSKLVQAARSLSLELARHKHKLAAQLVSMLGSYNSAGQFPGVKPVASGNWGCGSSRLGDPQLKLIIQWLAASVAGVPCLYFYTCSHSKLVKLDTLVRVLLDRQWTVGELATASLKYSQDVIDRPELTSSLFDELIGAHRSPSPDLPETEL